MRTVAVIVAAGAAGAARSAAGAGTAARTGIRDFMLRATPFHEGVIGFAVGGRSPGSRDRSSAPSRTIASPSGRAPPGALLRTSPVTVAGPRRIHTGLPEPPTLVCDVAS